jgi:hypothetical protein
MFSIALRRARPSLSAARVFFYLMLKVVVTSTRVVGPPCHALAMAILKLTLRFPSRR